MWAQQEKKKKTRVADTQNVIALVAFKNILLVEEFDKMEYLPHESINKKTLNGKRRRIVIETRAAAVSLREQGVGEKNL